MIPKKWLNNWFFWYIAINIVFSVFVALLYGALDVYPPILVRILVSIVASAVSWALASKKVGHGASF